MGAIASQHFDANARQNIGQETALTYGTGGQSRIISPVGFLARLYIRVTGNIALTLSNGGTAAFTTEGLWAMLQRVQLTTNNNINIVDVTGFGLFLINLLQGDGGFDPSGDSYPGASAQVGDINSQSRTAWYSKPSLVTGDNAYAFTLMIPVAINDYDPIGLIMLQNRRTVVTLTLTFDNPLTNNTITLTAGTGTATLGTVTATAEITRESFNLPNDESTWPDLSLVHTLTEDAIALSNTGRVPYSMPVGNTYMRVWQIITANGALSDAVDQFELRVNNSDIPYLWSAGALRWQTLRAVRNNPPTGCYLHNWYYQGSVNINGIRDLIDSKDTATLELIPTITSGTTLAAGDTIRNVREELVNLAA